MRQILFLSERIVYSHVEFRSLRRYGAEYRAKLDLLTLQDFVVFFVYFKFIGTTLGKIEKMMRVIQTFCWIEIVILFPFYTFR
jgi:hypothetical protein